MHKRLVGEFDAENRARRDLPVSASSAAMTIPLVEGDETLTVVPGTLSREDLTARFRGADAFAVMQNWATLHHHAEFKGRGTARRGLVCRAGIDVGTAGATGGRRGSGSEVPYFSMIVVPGGRNNPSAAGCEWFR